MDGPSTRRSFMGGALLGSAAALAAWSVPALARSPLGGAATDAEVLSRLAEIEQLSAFSYRYLVGSAGLAPPTAATLNRFLGHELVHLAALSAALRRLGAKSPSPPGSLTAADQALARLGVGARLADARLERAAVTLLGRLETLEVDAYNVAVSRLSDPAQLRIVVETATCDAQHLAVLRQFEYPGDLTRAVPYAFVPLGTEFSA